VSRLDRALVDRGLLNSRSRAAREIAAGRVSVNGRTADQSLPRREETPTTSPSPNPTPGSPAAPTNSSAHSTPSTSPTELNGLTALDAGASTGGFTQVLLTRGVAQVWAVDVGHDQLAPILRDDPRVHVREGLNLRELNDSDVPTVDLVVADVSFISLRLLIGPLLAATAVTGELLLMVKPQFELARASLDKHGVVTSREKRRRAIDSVLDSVSEHAGRVTDIAPSPLPGPSGNREYFLRVRPGRTHDQSDRLDQADIPAHLDEMMRGES
jgi:23S rRNA (cytidine1920-2'-O)/16S rRNA (cytidine1409-2'-O)-methyltransferase